MNNDIFINIDKQTKEINILLNHNVCEKIIYLQLHKGK